LGCKLKQRGQIAHDETRLVVYIGTLGMKGLIIFGIQRETRVSIRERSVRSGCPWATSKGSRN